MHWSVDNHNNNNNITTMVGPGVTIRRRFLRTRGMGAAIGISRNDWNVGASASEATVCPVTCLECVPVDGRTL